MTPTLWLLASIAISFGTVAIVCVVLTIRILIEEHKARTTNNRINRKIGD